MNLFLKKILTACFFSFFFAGIYGQVVFSTVISPGQIDNNEYATFRIVIENGGNIQEVNPPLFKNFTIIRGPIEERRVNSRYIALVFLLKPKHPGKLRIEPARAIVDGKVYKSNPVILLVKKAVSPAPPTNSYPLFKPVVQPRPRSDFNDYILRKEDDVAEKVNKNMFLRLEVDKTSCYVGEPVIASYNLYTRLKSESKLIRNPSFNGFSVIDLQQPDLSDYKRQKFNGKEYNVYTIRKAQLYALQPDTIDLEPAEIENDVQFIKEEYAARLPDLSSIFEDFSLSSVPPEAVVNQTIVLQSEPVSIIVKPLPEKGKPSSFKGAVGSFAISAVLQKHTFSTDEAGQLSVSVSGSGNMQLLTSPDIKWPAGIESFEPTVSDNLSLLTVPVSGSKAFEFSFAANSPGDYSLPAIHFSYFDPKTGSYKSLSTNPILFTVSKGTGNPLVFTKTAIVQENISFINKIFNHRWWVILFIAVMIFTGLIIWLLKEKKAGSQNVLPALSNVDEQINHFVELSALNQQNPLAETEKCLQSDECFEFYVLLNTELKNYLSYKFLIDSNEINSTTVITMMDKKGISNNIVLELQRIMHDVEWQLYTPFERNKKMNELYHSTMGIIQEINTYDVKHT